jgi:small subunit ribosomal protein S6
MRRYETIVIVDPDLSEEDRKALFTRINEVISQNEGVLIAEDPWGIKKLAYEINKKTRGFYIRIDFCGMGPLVDEMERQFRIDDRVMKFLTVLLNPEADVEKIKAEIEAAKAPSEEKVAAETEGSKSPTAEDDQAPDQADGDETETEDTDDEE